MTQYLAHSKFSVNNCKITEELNAYDNNWTSYIPIKKINKENIIENIRQESI